MTSRRRRTEQAPRYRVGPSKKTRIEAGGRCETTGKRRFPTKRDAVKAAALIKATNARKSRKALATVVYRCDPATVRNGCGDWHLTRNGLRTEGES